MGFHLVLQLRNVRHPKQTSYIHRGSSLTLLGFGVAANAELDSADAADFPDVADVVRILGLPGQTTTVEIDEKQLCHQLLRRRTHVSRASLEARDETIDHRSPVRAALTHLRTLLQHRPGPLALPSCARSVLAVQVMRNDQHGLYID